MKLNKYLLLFDKLYQIITWNTWVIKKLGP